MRGFLGHQWVKTTFFVLITVLLLLTVSTIFAEVGTKSDPLVAMSYVEKTLKPALENEIKATVEQKVKTLGTDLDLLTQTYIAELDGRVASLSGQTAQILNSPAFAEAVQKVITDRLAAANISAAKPAQLYTLVTIPAGKTVSCKAGCELVLRQGGATVVSPANDGGGLVNATTGTELAVNGALVRNNLYIVTVTDRGFKTKDQVKIMIRGEYVIK